MSAFVTSMPVRLDPESRTLDREVDLPPSGTTIRLGAHGGVAEHYGMATVPLPRPTSLDYLVASIAGCLIGTLAGSLRRARVRFALTDLTAVADGHIASGDDGVLRLERVLVRYELVTAAEFHEAATAAHADHMARCPNAQSVTGAIAIETALALARPAG